MNLLSCTIKRSPLNAEKDAGPLKIFPEPARTARNRPSFMIFFRGNRSRLNWISTDYLDAAHAALISTAIILFIMSNSEVFRRGVRCQSKGQFFDIKRRLEMRVNIRHAAAHSAFFYCGGLCSSKRRRHHTPTTRQTSAVEVGLGTLGLGMASV